METCINTMANDTHYSFSSDERKWINRIHKLKESYPNDVVICAEPAENDGMIVARFPIKWLKIAPPRKVSDEQRQAASERFKAMHSHDAE